MNLPDAFRYQARSCAALDSPFMERLLTLLANNWPENTDLARHCDTFAGDIGPNGASLPLRIASALHALVLGRHDANLASVYPPNNVSDADLIGAVLDAMANHGPFVQNWLKHAPQTNEVRRSAALIPSAHWIAARHPLPFVISELGASGGLNLMWDRYALETGDARLGATDPVLTLTPDWTGPVPKSAHVYVAGRAGVDLNPLDIRDPDQAQRLISYLWPDQLHRMALTRAAMSALNQVIEQGDAIDWLETRLENHPDGHIHLIYHTIAWQYFPADKQKKGRALIEAAGLQATGNRPLAWLRMEHDGDSANAQGAGLSLRLWPGDVRIDLARVDFHGRWVNWLADPFPRETTSATP